MKFQVKTYNNDNFFHVQVFLAGADTTDDDNCIWDIIMAATFIRGYCGWKGDEFEYENKRYAIIGPYHSFQENNGKYQVYELIPVSELSQ